MPSNELIDTRTGCLKPNNQLKEIFKTNNVDIGKCSVFVCYSGVTACIAELAWKLVSGKKAAVYDGSWQEYSTY